MMKLEEIGTRARQAEPVLRIMETEKKNRVLKKAAENLVADAETIIAANALDMEHGKEKGMSQGLLDRLFLDKSRIEAMAEGMCQVSELDDPIGEVLGMKKRPNGLLIGQKRVPLGVVGIIYLTGANHSIVLPVLNSQSNISCKIKRTSYFGILKWEGGSSQYAYVKDMPRHSEFTLGDTIVTSGYSAVFPAGIPVGIIDDMKDSHDGLSYLLKVKLFTDFAKLNDVQVISSTTGTEQVHLEDSARTASDKQ